MENNEEWKKKVFRSCEDYVLNAEVFFTNIEVARGIKEAVEEVGKEGINIDTSEATIDITIPFFETYRGLEGGSVTIRNLKVKLPE